MEIVQENEEEEMNYKAVFDLNWSHDGSVIAAGIEKQVVMLDINQLFSTPIESLLNQQNPLEIDYENQIMHSTTKNQNNIQLRISLLCAIRTVILKTFLLHIYPLGLYY